MGNLKEKVFTVCVIKSVEYIAQPSGRFILATRDEMILFSVFLGDLHSIELLFITAKIYSFG